ncbi:beta-1,4-mannosyltransferase egh-like [Microplitis demolitor]|uniref:beta-1,4-mannosyltransferase egh-like n=1 Tax=Microplitis demolitor TaxID=69319 RepID=UPI00235B5C50|nr:beta-1,4-mannosyltransferase egh-like [Microplitis demolitor]
MLGYKIKHILHCCVFLTIIIGALKVRIYRYLSGNDKSDYSTFTILFNCIKLATLISLPHMLFNFLGLILYDAFPGKVKLKGSPLLAPFINIRVVTRGDYPQLVKTNVKRNLKTCMDAGLKNFQIEVVTGKPIGLMSHRRIRELVVPNEYQTKTGALFKARNLQYCLEDGVNELADHDWIVHLDEETLLTENSIYGILNFVLDGKHPFGQGLITYANETVVNWITTVADSIRVTDDMGKLRFQFHTFHRPLFSIKGSFLVAQTGAEKHVSFDNGLDGSIAEDCFFALKADSLGYTFDFIEGEMWEMSVFTISDFIRQRTRWNHGIYLVITSNLIPLKNKIYVVFMWTSLQLLPLAITCGLLPFIINLDYYILIDLPGIFIHIITTYTYIYGSIQSISFENYSTLSSVMLKILLLFSPVTVILECIALVCAFFDRNYYKFYVVNKDQSVANHQD